MTHDPMCPVIPADANFSDWGCQCHLIAKVRADMLDKAVAAVQAVASDGGSVWSTGLRAVAAIDAQRGVS